MCTRGTVLHIKHSRAVFAYCTTERSISLDFYTFIKSYVLVKFKSSHNLTNNLTWPNPYKNSLFFSLISLIKLSIQIWTSDLYFSLSICSVAFRQLIRVITEYSLLSPFWIHDQTCKCHSLVSCTVEKKEEQKPQAPLVNYNVNHVHISSEDIWSIPRIWKRMG